MIYDDFESNLIPENNEKQNLDEPHTKKYQNYYSCIYGCKLVCVNDQFNQPLKSYLGQDALHKFITSMDKERKCCIRVMKKYFNKELAITKEDDENFGNPTQCWVCVNTFVESDVKVRDHCHVTGKYRCAAHKHCNINVSLNYEIPIVFHNQKKYDAYLIMQELGKFDFKVSIIPNGLDKYMSFSLDNKFCLY